MNAKDILFYGNRDLIRQFGKIPDEGWELPGVCGEWSAKDVLSHLTSYELLFLEVLRSLENQTAATPHIDMIKNSYSEFNNEQVTTRRKTPPVKILQEYTKTHKTIMGYLEKLPKKLFLKTGVVPWYGKEYCLDDFIVYLSYGHKKEHLAQVGVFIDRIATYR